MMCILHISLSPSLLLSSLVALIRVISINPTPRPALLYRRLSHAHLHRKFTVDIGLRDNVAQKFEVLCFDHHHLSRRGSL